MVNEQNFNKLIEAWINTYVSMVTVGQLALSETAENVFNLSTVKEPIITSKEVTLSPFETQTVPDVSKVMGHVKWVHVTADPVNRASPMKQLQLVCSDPKPSCSRVKICLQNLTSKKVIIPTQCAVDKIQATNEVPGMYAPVTPKGT